MCLCDTCVYVTLVYVIHVYVTHGQKEEALQHLHKSLEIKIHVYGKDHPYGPGCVYAQVQHGPSPYKVKRVSECAEESALAESDERGTHAYIQCVPRS